MSFDTSQSEDSHVPCRTVHPKTKVAGQPVSYQYEARADLYIRQARTLVSKERGAPHM